MTFTVIDALNDSVVLHAENEAHVADVQTVISRSVLRGEVAIIDSTFSDSPALHSTAAKVMLGTSGVEFSHLIGNHSVWRRS